MQTTTIGIIPHEAQPSSADPRIAFAMRLASALHRYGSPTHRLEEAMTQVLATLGLEGLFFSIPTGIFAGFGPPEEQRTAIIRADLGQINLEKLALLDDLVRRVISGTLDVVEADIALKSIVQRPRRYGHFIRFVCFALASATAARSLGGGWREIAVASTIGMMTGALMALAGRSEQARRVVETLAAILAGALAVVAARLIFPVSTFIP
ncbi:MAG: threonine/serine exporter family protein, partial [bacterium]|nr:threonine/serine exporter family protein [Candidatus Kapabacteria bacterium]